jgi:hypothetical protein
MSGDGTQLIVFCAGCGEPVVVQMADGPQDTVREPASEDPGASPGRVTISQGGDRVIHQCAPGSFLPPDQKATPRRA